MSVCSRSTVLLRVTNGEVVRSTRCGMRRRLNNDSRLRHRCRREPPPCGPTSTDHLSTTDVVWGASPIDQTSGNSYRRTRHENIVFCSRALMTAQLTCHVSWNIRFLKYLTADFWQPCHVWVWVVCILSGVTLSRCIRLTSSYHIIMYVSEALVQKHQHRSP